MKRKRNKKIWPSPTGIWTPDFWILDFWANSRPKFEFWGKLVLSSSWFLDFLDFIIDYAPALNKLLFNKTCSSIDWTDRQIFYFNSIFDFDFDFIRPLMFRKSPLLENKKLHFSTNEFDKKGYFIVFSNFSCMFLNPNNFFQFEF